MMTLRCTKKLLKRMRLPTDLKSEPIPPTTALGDWYANYLVLRPAHLILFVNERSRLPLLLPAKTMETLTPRFRAGVLELLLEIGVPFEAAEREVTAMEKMEIRSTSGPAAARSVLGTITDFERMLEYYLQEERTLLEHSIHLSNTPCKPIDYRRPHEVARDLLATPPRSAPPART